MIALIEKQAGYIEGEYGMAGELIERQARYMERKHGMGGELIGDSIERGDPPELHQAVVRGVQLGQFDLFSERLAQRQRELIAKTLR